MNRSNRRHFSPEFKLEAAQLVLDQHYTVAATAMNVGKNIKRHCHFSETRCICVSGFRPQVRVTFG